MSSSPLALPWKRSLVGLASPEAGYLLIMPSLEPWMPRAVEEMVALQVGCVTSLLCSLLVGEAVVVQRMKMRIPPAQGACG